jgi:hypothetical protein
MAMKEEMGEGELLIAFRQETWRYLQAEGKKQEKKERKMVG